MSIYDFSPPPSDEDEEVALTPILLGESKDDQSDVRFIKLLVSFTLGITLILAAGYLAAVVLSDGAILLRPSEVALQRHANYNTLVQPADEALTGAGVVACIVDSGLAPGHEDLEGINLVGWKISLTVITNPTTITVMAHRWLEFWSPMVGSRVLQETWIYWSPKPLVPMAAAMMQPWPKPSIGASKTEPMSSPFLGRCSRCSPLHFRVGTKFG